MKTVRRVGSCMVAALFVALSTAGGTDGDRADDAAKPVEAKTEAKAPDVRNVRIIRPFSALTDLSAEQTERMKQIHRKYLDQIKALETRQHEELMAVLTEEQKRELLDAEAKERIAKKVASAKSKEKSSDAKPGETTTGKTGDSAPSKPPSP